MRWHLCWPLTFDALFYVLKMWIKYVKIDFITTTRSGKTFDFFNLLAYYIRYHVVHIDIFLFIKLKWLSKWIYQVCKQCMLLLLQSEYSKNEGKNPSICNLSKYENTFLCFFSNMKWRYDVISYMTLNNKK